MIKKKDKLDVENLNVVISLTKRILRIGLIIAIISLVVLATSLLKSWNVFAFIKTLLIVISPVFIGLIIAWLFDPIVDFLETKKVPRILGCIIVYIVFFGGIILLLSIMLPSFVSQIKDFVSDIPAILKDLKIVVNNLLTTTIGGSGLDINAIKTDVFKTIETFGGNLATNLPNNLINIISSFVSGGMVVVLGIMVGFYMLFDFKKVGRGIIELTPNRFRDDMKDLMQRLNYSLRGYIQGLFGVMFLVFITQSIGLSLAGLQAPLIFALFCALTDIIPYLGPYIGGAPAIIVGFTISPTVGLFTLVSIVVVQLLENNFYQPLIMGKAMKLHPVTIIIGLLIFQHFFGIIGMIVATPVIACLKVIFNFFDEKLHILNKIREN